MPQEKLGTAEETNLLQKVIRIKNLTDAIFTQLNDMSEILGELWGSSPQQLKEASPEKKMYSILERLDDIYMVLDQIYNIQGNQKGALSFHLKS